MSSISSSLFLGYFIEIESFRVSCFGLFFFSLHFVVIFLLLLYVYISWFKWGLVTVSIQRNAWSYNFTEFRGYELCIKYCELIKQCYFFLSVASLCCCCFFPLMWELIAEISISLQMEDTRFKSISSTKSSQVILFTCIATATTTHTNHEKNDYFCIQSLIYSQQRQ